MAPGLPRTSPRTSITSSRLVRHLAGLGVAHAADSKQTFAERLGPWLNWTDAIALAAALNGAAAARPPHVGSGAAVAATVEEFTRVREDLALSITADAADPAGAAPTPSAPDAVPGDTADFAPWRRRYLAHQRAMDASIKPLRSSLRAALSGLSPALARLAALDAVMDEALAARERQLLSSLPSLLEKHFVQLRSSHGQAPAEPAQAGSNPVPRSQPAGWLARYGKDMQAVLLAELEIRWHPVEGMMEAMVNEASARP